MIQRPCCTKTCSRAFLRFQLSFLMPNNLQSSPRRYFGLRITTTCISTPPFSGNCSILRRAGAECSSHSAVSVREGLHHDQRPFPGADGDAIRPLGVFVADAQWISCRQRSVSQLVE